MSNGTGPGRNSGAFGQNATIHPPVPRHARETHVAFESARGLNQNWKSAANRVTTTQKRVWSYAARSSRRKLLPATLK
eukprot:987333-Rhodomonas_salina.1